ncbi:MAG: TIGR04283 family arsenosugar biosynthesis glycosyltransferase [Acidimicrobiales bacterium]
MTRDAAAGTTPTFGAGEPLSVAIVVPLLNEAPGVGPALARLRRDFPGAELVAVDGGSTDHTVELAERYCRVVRSPRGRACQMNAGARATASDVVWFVHADVTVAPSALDELRTVLADPGVVGGGLSLRFDARSVGLAYLAWSSTRRARHLQQVFGDQALFVRRRVLDEVGGFPDLPIMEDLELCRRLRRRGRLAVLPATATASARRFADHGTWSMIAYMQYLKALYVAGIDPEGIARRYGAGPPWVRSGPGGAAPSPGRGAQRPRPNRR